MREKKGAMTLGQPADRAGLFADVHDAQPQRHHAGQRQGDVHHAHLGGVEGAVDDALEDFGIAQENPLGQCRDEANQEEAGPDVIQCHVVCRLFNRAQLCSGEYRRRASCKDERMHRRHAKKLCTPAAYCVCPRLLGHMIRKLIDTCHETPHRRRRPVSLCQPLAPAAAAAARREPAQVLHMFLSTSETGLDPAVASDIATLSLLENLFDPLLRYDYLARPVKLRGNTATACRRRGWRPQLHLPHPPRHLFHAGPGLQGQKREVTAPTTSTASSACTTRPAVALAICSTARSPATRR
jgi:hypothetical protein